MGEFNFTSGVKIVYFLNSKLSNIHFVKRNIAREL